MPPASRSLEPFRTDIPARLDRLPWSRFHWLVVLALGASWAIDGLEVVAIGLRVHVLPLEDVLGRDGVEVAGGDPQVRRVSAVARLPAERDANPQALRNQRLEGGNVVGASGGMDGHGGAAGEHDGSDSDQRHG